MCNTFTDLLCHLCKATIQLLFSINSILMENLNGTGKLVGALVIGALAGAALGILFAPEKGSKTRSNIIDGAKDMADDLKKKMTDEAAALRKKAEKLEDMVKDKAEEVFESGKHKAEDAVKH